MTIPATQAPPATRAAGAAQYGLALPLGWAGPDPTCIAARRGAAGPVPGGPAERLFVGRRAELDVLAGEAAAAERGSPRLVLVEGEPGIGKSALISEFLAGQGQIPLMAASGEASEQELPYGLVRQLAGGLSGRLAAGCPALAAGPAADADPLAVGAELLTLLASRRGAAGLMVIIEDLQWADQQSSRALLYAFRRLTTGRPQAGGQALVILAGRPTGLGRLGEGWARFLQAERGCRKLALTGFGRSELGLLASAAGRSALPGRALGQVADCSGGSPGLARALLTEVPDHVLSGPRSEISAPGSLSAVVLPRLAGLRGDARDLVIAAAVLGERCALSDAALLGGVPAADDALDLAAEAGFLIAEPAHRQVRFVQELTRRAVYADIGAAMRRSLHRWAATLTDGAAALDHRVAAASGPDLPLATELDAAASAAAADAAAGRGAPGLAARYLTQGAELGARGPERAGRLLTAFELLLRAADAAAADVLRPLIAQLPAGTRRDAGLGQLAMLTGHPAEAQALLLSAWAAYQPESLPRESGPQAPCQQAPGQPDGAVLADLAAPTGLAAGDDLAADQAGAGQLRLATVAADRTAAAEAAAGLAVLHGSAGSPAEAGRWAGLAVATAGDQMQCPALLGPQATALALAGQRGRARQLLCGLPAAAAMVPAEQCDALTVRGVLRLGDGDLHGAAGDLSVVVTRIRAGLRVRQPGQALGYLAVASLSLGRWDDARQLAELAISSARDDDRAADLPLAHSAATAAAALRGDWRLAGAHAQAAQQAAGASGTGPAMLHAAAARAVLGFARNDPAEVLAATALATPMPLVDALDDPAARLGRQVRVWALIRTGALGPAEQELDQLGTNCAAARDDSQAVHCAWLRASLELARNAPTAAERALGDCGTLADSAPDPLARALFQVEFARCLARRHKRPAALARLRAGHEILTALQARPLMQTAAAELAALGLQARPDADQQLPGLTPQELQVARLVAGGMSNREAAAVLYLSPKTIEYHLAHIFAKLGIRTRYQLAARLRQQPGPVVSRS